MDGSEEMDPWGERGVANCVLGDTARGRETEMETVVTRGPGVAVDVAEDGSDDDPKTLEDPSVGSRGAGVWYEPEPLESLPEAYESRVPLLVPVPDA